MTDEELEAQRASYVRGEMGLGSDRDEAAYQAEQEAAPARPAEVVTTPLRVGGAPRATGWAIMDNDGLLLAVDGIFRSDLKPHEVRWLNREPVSEYMMDAHAVFLDKATLQQVQKALGMGT